MNPVLPMSIHDAQAAKSVHVPFVFEIFIAKVAHEKGIIIYKSQPIARGCLMNGLVQHLDSHSVIERNRSIE
jgi:hypothetical protein